MTIELHTWNTPNGHKIHIALEELGLAYRAIAVNIAKGDQFKPEFLKISPNNKIPALVDPDGPGGKRIRDHGIRCDPDLSRREDRIALAQGDGRGQLIASSAMARLADGRLRADAGAGASLHRAGERPTPYGVARFSAEAKRLYGVLDRRLEGRNTWRAPCGGGLRHPRLGLAPAGRRWS